MSISSRRFAAGALAAVLAATGGIASAAGGDRSPNRPPWNKRCGIEIRAHDDGSASLYCDERTRPFGAIDAESGRIQFFRTR
jgi:hypothetical protein